MAKKKKGLSDRVRLSKFNKHTSNSLHKVQTNPFEIKVNHQKHNILGRKTKHDRGLPGISRSKAHKKRKDTLLHEYKQRNKANRIKDERLGVNDEQISLEEKMLQRFALERKKKHEKMSQFNLNEDEELTHLGQSLSTVNRFDDFVDSDEDDADVGGTMSGEYVEHAHFGGGIIKKKSDEVTEQNENKSRKDIIEEIIAKSKTAKFEKQASQEKSDELREKLDAAWEDFRELIKPSCRTAYDKEIARERSKPDGYDVALKQMLFDKKATPTERKKTEQEQIAEKEALLKKHEEERRMRMQMDQGKKQPKHQSADALEDEFVIKKEHVDIEPLSYPMLEDVESDDDDEEDSDELPSTLDEDAHSNTPEQESEIGDQGIVDDGDSLDAEEDEDVSDNYSDIDSGNEEDVDLQSLDEEEEHHKEEEEKKDLNETKDKFPSSYVEFSALISSRNIDHPEAASSATARLREEYAPALRKGNKAKMIELFAYVWEHCCVMASQSPPQVAVISSLTSHLYELCAMNVDNCSQCVVERLKRSYHVCFSSGKMNRPRWPTFEIIIQFKLIKLLYSTSDFSHSVVTPALLFMCNLLNNCRVTSSCDIARGLFLCTLAYEYVCFSKRLVPECLNFLVAILSMSISQKKQLKLGLPEIATVHLTKSNFNTLVIKKRRANYSDAKPNLTELLQEKSDSEECPDETKCQLIATALRLVERFASLYSELSAFDEVFSPLLRVCNVIKDNSRNPPVLTKRVESALESIASHCNKPRKPLSFGPSRPKLLRMFDPKIEDVGEPFEKRSKNLSAAKRERDRLLHIRRREMKGAMREIKKDAKFLSRQQQKEQQQMDDERSAKVKRLFGLLSNQEGEVKNIQRKKYKLDV